MQAFVRHEFNEKNLHFAYIIGEILLIVIWLRLVMSIQLKYNSDPFLRLADNHVRVSQTVTVVRGIELAS